MSNPDRSSNLIGLLAPISVVVAYLLETNGFHIPTEVQYAIASILFFSLSWFVGKPSALSRRNRHILKEFLPEAPLDSEQIQELDRQTDADTESID